MPQFITIEAIIVVRIATQSQVAKAAGVTRSAVGSATKTCLAAAMCGNKVDLDHPDAKAYIKRKSGQRKIKRKPTLADMNGGYIERPPAVPVDNPEPGEPLVRGRAVYIKSKKEAAIAKRDASAGDASSNEPPKDVTDFGEMTLNEIARRHGTDVEFCDWLKAAKLIEDIAEKRLKNAVTEGKLVSRDLVQKGVIEAFDEAHMRMLTDGVESILVNLQSMIASGSDKNEMLDLVKDQISSFIKPAKNKVKRSMKSV